jgi:hypothetical protein
MKTPRIKDFDPNSKEILVLKSSLDNMPVIQKPKPADNEAKTTPVPPVRVVPLVPPIKTTKRYMKPRHPFDIYHD